MRKGFTLIELLAVIVILAIISLIAIPRLMGSIDEARTNAIYNNKLNMVKAAEAYMVSREGMIPTNIDEAVVIDLTDLVTTNNIKEISEGSGSCNGIVIVSKRDSGSINYEPHLSCSGSEVLLSAKYTLDNTLSDYSGNGNDLTGNTAANFIEGRDKTKALSFTSADDFFLLNSNISSANDITISAWFRTSRVSSYRFINHADNFSYAYGHRNSTIFSLWNPTRDITLSSAITANNWHHQTFVKEGNNLRIYHNGELVGEDTWTSTIIFNMLGGTPANSSWSYFVGSIDEVTVFERALSSNEVKAMHMIMNN